MTQVIAKTRQAFHFGPGQNLAAGQLLLVDEKDLARFGPALLVPATPDEIEAGRKALQEKQALPAQDKQQRTLKDK